MRPPRLVFGVLPLLLVFALASCGGGGASGSQKARLSIKVTWPPRTRLIPEAANSIKVTVTVGADEVTSRLLARPPQGQGTTSVTIDQLPPSPAVLKATAYPNADGTGVAQASGATAVTLQSNVVVAADITMDSTIDHLELDPPSPTVKAGASVPVNVVAKDKTGALVLVWGPKMVWTSSDPTRATVDPTGITVNLTGVAQGPTTLSVTDQESGKHVQVIVGVDGSGGAGGGPGPFYRVIDLGTLGGPTSIATGVNSVGQVCGFSDTGANKNHPFIWSSQSGMQDIDPSGPDCEAWGVNDSGQVVGNEGGAGGSGAFVWSQGSGLHFLGTLGGTGSEALAINANGAAAGDAGTTLSTHAFQWTSGAGLLDLGALSGANGVSIGRAINDEGVIVGSTTVSPQDAVHAFKWTSGSGMQDLTGVESQALGVNASGAVVGQFQAANVEAFYWSGSTGLVDIGNLGGSAGGTASVANAINGGGLVVGNAHTQTQGHAFVWTASTGILDLNTMLDPNSTGWTLSTANAINPSGWIVGVGTNPQSQGNHAYLAIPTGG